MAPRAIEGEHQLPAQPVPQRVLRDERLELRHQMIVATQTELSGEPLLLGVEPKPLEPGDLGAGEGLESEVVERGAPPERERLREQPAAHAGRSCPRLLDEPLEAQRVHGLGFEREPVSGRLGQECVRPDDLAQRGDGVLERAERGTWRVGAPEILDQAVGRDDLAGMKCEHGEERPLLAARQRHD